MGSKLIKGNGEVKVFFYGLEKFRRGDFSNIKIIDDAFLKIEEVRKYSLGILEFFSLRESREFFCNLVMVERENDIAEIEEDHLNRDCSSLANP